MNYRADSVCEPFSEMNIGILKIDSSQSGRLLRQFRSAPPGDTVFVDGLFALRNDWPNAQSMAILLLCRCCAAVAAVYYACC